jgi:ankyrin repeat protein
MMEPHPGTAAMLIEMGADVNLPDDQGMPPLARAAFGGYYRLVKMLLQANADPRMRDSVRARMDVLQYACMASASENEVLKVVKALLAAGADPSYVSGQTLKAVDYAQNNSFPRVVELLIRAEQEISSNKPG